MITDTIEILLRDDPRAMGQLELVRDFGPEGAYIAAGFVRNRVWDSFYDPRPRFTEADVDVVYFCKADASKTRDLAYEAVLREQDLDTDWQVRNQARMHKFGGHLPFTSVEHALMHWAETATSVGVRLDENGDFQFLAPMGFDDLGNHTLRITPVMKATDPEGFEQRLATKGWIERWPNLRIIRT